MKIELFKNLMLTLHDDATDCENDDDVLATIDKVIVALTAFKVAAYESDEMSLTEDEINDFVADSVLYKHIECLEIDDN